MNIFYFSAFFLFFLQISTLCLYPFWNSLSLSNSSYNIAFSFSLVTNLFFRMFTYKIKFPIFKLTIATVWNNSATLFAFITFVATFSTNFGVLVYVVGSLDPFVDDPSSCAILFPISNSNGNPSTNSGLLGGTWSSVSLGFNFSNFSKASYVATLYVYSLITCRPSYFCYCY
jgi:hypothetical protein